jgi:RNA polymerase sigma factor (sigma-70 family)
VVDVERYDNLVASIAYEFSRKYQMVDAADVRQELWVWFLEHPNKVRVWESLDNKQSTKLIARSLRNAAKDFCQREKAKTSGYHVTDNHYYDKAVIEEILPAVLRGDTQGPILLNLGFTKNKQVASEGGNWLAMKADVERGIDRLPVEQKSIVFLRFGDGCNSNDELGKELGISEDAARMRVNRALNNLLNFLGGHKPIRERDYTEEETNDAGNDAPELDTDSVRELGEETE